MSSSFQPLPDSSRLVFVAASSVLYPGVLLWGTSGKWLSFCLVRVGVFHQRFSNPFFQKLFWCNSKFQVRQSWGEAWSPARLFTTSVHLFPHLPWGLLWKWSEWTSMFAACSSLCCPFLTRVLWCDLMYGEGIQPTDISDVGRAGKWGQGQACGAACPRLF